MGWQLLGRQSPASLPPLHGGPDALGVPRHDFSSNANAAGPLPSVAEAVARADRSRYPDPGYHALREQLAAWHGVAPARVVVAGSASEFIHRFTAFAARWRGVQRAMVPRPGYGDYASAAHAAGLQVCSHDGTPTACSLEWFTEPTSPGGASHGAALGPQVAQAHACGACVVLDLAYQPLRFDAGKLPPHAALAWQLWAPNKACGLPGIRAAYAVAPAGDEPAAEALRAHAPSWVAGAEGVALLAAFATPAAQDELVAQRPLLRAWREALAATLRAAHWQVQDAASVTPFFTARPAHAPDWAAWRALGLKLRDTTGMGLPGWWRLSAQPPQSLQALQQALEAGQ
jgi:histidinol-phosphate aminotransferase